MKKTEESLQELWDTMKGNKTEIIFKAVMAENFPNLGREMDI